MRNIIRWVLVAIAIIIGLVALFFPELPVNRSSVVDNPVIKDPKKTEDEPTLDVQHEEVTMS